MATQKEQKITITASRRPPSKDEVDRMMKEAESHADEDQKRKEEIETRNLADQAVYASERLSRMPVRSWGSSDKAAVESAAEEISRRRSSGTTWPR